MASLASYGSEDCVDSVLDGGDQHGLMFVSLIATPGGAKATPRRLERVVLVRNTCSRPKT